MDSEPIVGIDLGTTNSEVACVIDGRPQVFAEGGDRGVVPSAVGLDRDGRVIVGREALNQYAAAPERTVLSIKRRMGSADRVLLGEESYTPQEVSAFILRALRERAERTLGRPVQKAVITVPAYFSDAQRQATREAGAIAGLEVVRILNEPTAAALVYEAGHGEAARVLVYDLGGGTFDVSVVRIERGVVEVLAAHGDTHLGGDDFDEAIVTLLLERLAGGGAGALAGDRLVRARLRRAAEAAKIELSSRPHARIAEDHLGEVAGTPVHLVDELSRRDLEALVDEALDRTLACVTRALADADLKPAQIDRVLLVGGSTRIPRVAELLRAKLGQEPHGEIDPDLSVALGAAVQAGMEMGVEVRSVLVDITPHTFGTSCLGEPGEPEHRFVPLIRRNTRLPAERSDVFYTVHEHQESVDLEVCQGEEEDASRNLRIATFRFTGLNRTPGLRERGLVFTYRLDLDGVLAVHAVERGSGREIRGQVENAIGRSTEADLATARERVADRWGGAEAATPDAAPRSGAAGALPPRFGEVVDRAGRAAAAASAEDRDEMTALIAAIRQALERGEDAAAETARRDLEEILFYLE